MLKNWLSYSTRPFTLFKMSVGAWVRFLEHFLYDGYIITWYRPYCFLEIWNIPVGWPRI